MRTVIFVVMIVSFASCTDPKVNSEIITREAAFSMAPPPLSMLETSEVLSAEPVQSFNSSQVGNISGQKLIREAYLSFEVDDLDASYDSIKNIITQFRAYASNERQSNDIEQVEQLIDVRVDASSFDAVIDRILLNAKKIKNKNISVRDVTDEFVDINARLRTKKEIERRYYDILRQARSVKDMISIEEQLGAVREEIESIEARVNVMSKQISYSTIHLEFSELVIAVSKPLPGFGSKALASFKKGWDGLKDFILEIVSIWPLLTICALLLVVIVRFVHRKHKEETLTESV